MGKQGRRKASQHTSRYNVIKQNKYAAENESEGKKRTIEIKVFDFVYKK